MIALGHHCWDEGCVKWIWIQEAAQKVFDGKTNILKVELATLKNQLEANNHTQQKVKKKHASSVEEYENQISHLTSSITKLEAAKSGLDEEMISMTTEQRKLQERLKAGDSKLREMESKLEAERVKHAQALAHEVAKVPRMIPLFDQVKILVFQG